MKHCHARKRRPVQTCTHAHMHVQSQAHLQVCCANQPVNFCFLRQTNHKKTPTSTLGKVTLRVAETAAPEQLRSKPLPGRAPNRRCFEEIALGHQSSPLGSLSIHLAELPSTILIGFVDSLKSPTNAEYERPSSLRRKDATTGAGAAAGAPFLALSRQ